MGCFYSKGRLGPYATIDLGLNDLWCCFRTKLPCEPLPCFSEEYTSREYKKDKELAHLYACGVNLCKRSMVFQIVRANRAAVNTTSAYWQVLVFVSYSRTFDKFEDVYLFVFFCFF